MSLLQRVGRVQESFLEDSGIDAINALLVFNLSPLSLRRAIAMLSLIRRTMLREDPMHFKQLFYRADLENRRTLRFNRHRFRMHENIGGKQVAL